MAAAGESTVLEEQIDPNYEPTEEEIVEYMHSGHIPASARGAAGSDHQTLPRVTKMTDDAALTSVLGWHEDADQLNLVATFLDPKSIGAAACTCRFVRDNLRDADALRWLAELRGLDPATTGISCVEHIELAEAMASLETSIGFDRGSVDVRPAALPSVGRVVEMLRRHTSLTLSVEAHCGLDAHADFAQHFSQRRALSVRRTMERVAEEQGAPGALDGRILTRSFGNRRPLVWLSGSEPAGRVNARVEIYLSHQSFEAPKRRPLTQYARPPGKPAPALASSDEEVQALEDARFDVDSMDDELANEEIFQQMVMLQVRGQGWLIFTVVARPSGPCLSCPCVAQGGLLVFAPLSRTAS